MIKNENTQTDHLGSGIRPIARADVLGLKELIDASGLFPSAMLDDMIEPYLGGHAPHELWLTIDRAGPIAIAYCAPERMTQGTWNLLLIAVHPRHQGQALGASLIGHLEGLLAGRGERVLLVETSGLAAFERTRAFYDKLGYDREARIRDFYQGGEDKIIFRKAL